MLPGTFISWPLMKSDKKKKTLLERKKKNVQSNAWSSLCGYVNVLSFSSCFYTFFRKQEGLAPLLNFIQKVKHKYKRGETQKVGN